MKDNEEWISSTQLERLIDMHPKVRASAVILGEDGRWGEQLLAIVEPVAREHLSRRDVHAFLSARLPSSQLPDAIMFVVELPRTHDGKPDRCCLREMYMSRVRAGGMD